MYSIRLLLAVFIVLLLAVAAFAASVGNNSLNTVMVAVAPPIMFAQCDAQLVTGLNRTTGVSNVTATQSVVDVVPYCCFEAGFDGWRYWDSEGDGAGAGVLRGYYDPNTGYATPGSIILATENAPTGFTGYSYVFVAFNYTWSNTSIPVTLTFAYMYSTFIFSTVTGDLYAVITDENMTVIWYQLIDSSNRITRWSNVTLNLTGVLPGPGLYYLVFYVDWSTGGFGFSNSLYVYIDDVHIYVVPPEDTWYGCTVHINVTDSSGTAWLELVNYTLAPDTSYIDLYAVNGVYTSTHIVYNGTTWLTTSTSQIPVNSSDNLLNYVDVKLLFRTTGASTQTSTIYVNTCFQIGGVILCGLLVININR